MIILSPTNTPNIRKNGILGGIYDIGAFSDIFFVIKNDNNDVFFCNINEIQLLKNITGKVNDDHHDVHYFQHNHDHSHVHNHNHDHIHKSAARSHVHNRNLPLHQQIFC